MRSAVSKLTRGAVSAWHSLINLVASGFSRSSAASVRKFATGLNVIVGRPVASALGLSRTAIAAVVNPEARQRLKAATTESPNRAILADLVQRGVQIELCEDAMRKKGVAPAELMSRVKLVVGAYSRLIDLQLQGFAYIKFE